MKRINTAVAAEPYSWTRSRVKASLRPGTFAKIAKTAEVRKSSVTDVMAGRITSKKIQGLVVRYLNRAIGARLKISQVFPLQPDPPDKPPDEREG